MMNAIQKEIRQAATDHVSEHTKTTKCPFRCVSAPPDGLCAYHSVIASMTFPEWSEVARHSNGIAVNRRQEQAESSAAKALRDHVLHVTPQLHDPILQQQGFEASKFMSLDIGELSWLGNALGVSIRCIVEEEAHLDKIVYCRIVRC